MFEKKDSRVKSAAATNLSFLYYLVSLFPCLQVGHVEFHMAQIVGALTEEPWWWQVLGWSLGLQTHE